MNPEFASNKKGESLPEVVVERVFLLYKEQKARIFWNRYGLLQLLLGITVVIAIISSLLAPVSLKEIICFAAYVLLGEAALLYSNNEPLRKLKKRQFRYSNEVIRSIEKNNERFLFCMESGLEISAAGHLLEDAKEFKVGTKCVIIMFADKELTRQEGGFTPIIIKAD